eukprot:CAMPEP_0170582896 /NCGR_PEP_ID=MMETSP0224-20130122/7833_1 /TAXON_ID=285029 /ORGANISM="Togula jolla, Strain CCCM 725" /LENGTH=206 /DNA_ID=CAMNT_0010906161 /DNA_START=160 /DNA_END=781 /DNA_ORIENTATION=+
MPLHAYLLLSRCLLLPMAPSWRPGPFCGLLAVHLVVKSCPIGDIDSVVIANPGLGLPLPAVPVGTLLAISLPCEGNGSLLSGATATATARAADDGVLKAARSRAAPAEAFSEAAMAVCKAGPDGATTAAGNGEPVDGATPDAVIAASPRDSRGRTSPWASTGLCNAACAAVEGQLSPSAGCCKDPTTTKSPFASGASCTASQLPSD